MNRRQRLALTFGLASAVALAGLGYLPAVLAGNPMVILVPTSLQFGKQSQGTSSAPQRVVLTNNGNADLVISGVTVGGLNATDFSPTSDCPVAPATLPAGASCAIQVVFKPTGTGAETAALSILDNASGSPHSAALSGTATPPVPAVRLTPAKLNFDNQTVGTVSAPKTITVANAGSATLNITGNITISGENSAEFRLIGAKAACPVTGGQLAPGTSCTLSVLFAPAALGRKTAEVIVRDDAEGSPHAVPLAGVAAPRR